MSLGPATSDSAPNTRIEIRLSDEAPIQGLATGEGHRWEEWVEKGDEKLGHKLMTKMGADLQFVRTVQDGHVAP